MLSGSSFSQASGADTLRDTNEALKCWIKDVYHQSKHLGTGQTPL
ncbi:hypothetical protein DFAR_670008 [Desulfarculales bacterium]